MSEWRRQQVCAPIPMPASMATSLEGYQWAPITIGESGSNVYRLYGKPKAPDLFLKRGKYDVADDVTDEMVRLRWLAERIPVPTVVNFVRTLDEAWLLTTAMPGRTVYEELEANPDACLAIADALADFLRRLHEIPTIECPFNSNHIYRLALARKRIEAGMVEVDDFDDERKGWAAEQVWDAMHNLLPFTPDPVTTHGDFSLENLFVREGKVTGCIDVGRSGVADRYQDIAILWNRLGEFGSLPQERFVEQYGITDVDRRKLSFHLMLDELF